MKFFLIISVLCMQCMHSAPKNGPEYRSNRPKHGALLGQKCEPMGIECAQLGGIWLHQLPEQILNMHLAMGKREIEATTQKGNDRPSTNFATFALSCILENSAEIKCLLMPNEKGELFFSSEPHMRLDSNAQVITNQKFYQQSEKDCKEKSGALSQNIQQISQKFDKMKEDFNESNEEKILGKIPDLQKLLELFEKLKKEKNELIQVQENQKAQYEREYFNIFEELAKARQKPKTETASATAASATSNSGQDAQTANYEELMKDYENYYDGYRNHAYDSEQLITRIIDAYIEKNDITQLKDIDETPIGGEVKYFVLNLHTRFDMCPFCLMYLASHVQKWEKKFNRPFLAIVSSRQDYLCNEPFIMDRAKKYGYQGFAMRFIGGSKEIRKKIEQATKEITEQKNSQKNSFANNINESLTASTVTAEVPESIIDINAIQMLEKISLLDNKRLVMQYMLPNTVYYEETQDKLWAPLIQKRKQLAISTSAADDSFIGNFF